ncbi:DarT ssDNA thymidine ADP-ribosyltransferase family protein [Syntrophorhabdus aromaticivorans]|jgi:hypothetical protein|uniref:DUF4433 domain-containing protein n=1 Tax=Syntrophorhabdus aromaticivorans TaxID=328301 RepID=A0A971RZS0_9BACT|nr:DarT ssDNA thymidine ADP-ribosyltransferase family protein [Syntrophorhabdus aromaticivorans]NLW34550.1 DUF4433 domain-containing protein [Syntrophorhabdus aromaticivorans]
MSVEDVIKDRCIREVLHFTTHLGLIGILDSKYVVSRQRLPEDKRLEYILNLNAARRLDTAWLDYVNLSISRINSAFYEIASEKWHPTVQWRILSFDPVILTHEGVYFTTTNNIYPRVLRGTRGKGLEALFALRIVGRYDSVITRGPTTPDCYPTCVQAEVLYPQKLSTDYLRKIYVIAGEEQDDVNGQISALRHREVIVEINPWVFGGNGE